MPDLLEVVANPVTTIAAAVAVVGGWLTQPMVLLDAVAGVAWADAGTLFTTLSVAASTLAPELAWLPVAPLRMGALVFGALFVIAQLTSLGRGLKNRLTDEE